MNTHAPLDSFSQPIAQDSMDRLSGELRTGMYRYAMNYPRSRPALVAIHRA
jgi:hypothetical protein